MSKRLNTFIEVALVLPFIFSGLVACQEESTTHQAAPPNSPSASAPSGDTDMNPTQKSSTITTPFNLLGTVEAIEGNSYTIKSSTGENLSVEPTASVLVDESLEVGDRVEVQYSETDQPIAVRKVRGEVDTPRVSKSSMEDGLMVGSINRIDQEKGIYALMSVAGENIEFETDTNTLVDESIRVGDQVEVSLSENKRPIAIRKVRPQ